MTISRAALEEATASLEALRQLEGEDIEWSQHAINRVMERPGLHLSYVEDMIARPYGEVYRQPASNRLVLYDPDTDTPTGKPRAVVVALDHGSAVIISVYNVHDARRRDFENEDGYDWIGSLRDDCDRT